MPLGAAGCCITVAWGRAVCLPRLRGETGQEGVRWSWCFRVRSMNGHLPVSEGVTATACVFMLDPKHQFYLCYSFSSPSPNSEKRLSPISLSVLLAMS